MCTNGPRRSPVGAAREIRGTPPACCLCATPIIAAIHRRHIAPQPSRGPQAGLAMSDMACMLIRMDQPKTLPHRLCVAWCGVPQWLPLRPRARGTIHTMVATSADADARRASVRSYIGVYRAPLHLSARQAATTSLSFRSVRTCDSRCLSGARKIFLRMWIAC